jgi:transcriptional regulator with XRE-family HTH domain
MSIRSIFAGNLRRLSSREKSHAHVARELGLNRQQFNGYVTGKNLPNERVIDNICAYFQVDVGTLFREADPAADFQNIVSLTDRQRKFIDNVISDEKASSRQALQDGLYYVYFSVAGDREMVACSLMAVKREGGLTTFRRVTRLGGASGGLRPRTRGVHAGAVIFRDGLAFFMGLDTIDNAVPTILVGRPSASSEILYAGQAHLATDTGFAHVKFLMTPVPKRTKVWKAMHRVKFYQRSEIQSFSKRIFDFFSESSDLIY